MNNHVLLIKEQNLGDVSLIMQRMLTRYAGWFEEEGISFPSISLYMEKNN